MGNKSGTVHSEGEMFKVFIHSVCQLPFDPV